MPIDRRALLAVMGLMSLSSGACAQPPLSANSLAPWQDYRRRFITADGRVVDTGNKGVSHSEGQGFGLLMALHANDRDSFSSLFQWTEKTLTHPDSGLYAWRYDPSSPTPVADPNNATDGDILIAWALQLAGRRWRNSAYSERAKRLKRAILDEATLSFAGHQLLLPGRIGFAKDEAVVLNPSYYVWPALDDFAAEDEAWKPLIQQGLDLTAAAGFGRWRLPTDWTQIDREGLVSPAMDRPARFGFDAVRVPLYLAWSGRMNALAPFRRYWTETRKANGWPAWIDVTTDEVAPYLASDGVRAIAALTLGQPLDGVSSPEDYYSQSLYMLAAQARGARRP